MKNGENILKLYGNLKNQAFIYVCVYTSMYV